MLNQDPPQELRMWESEEIRQPRDYPCMYVPLLSGGKTPGHHTGDGYKILDHFAN